MTASGYARQPDGAEGGATAQFSTSVRYALAVGLLVVGIADLAAIDLVLLPRYFAQPTRVVLPQSPSPPVAVAPEVAPAGGLPQANPPVAESPPPPAPIQPPPAEVAPPQPASANLAESEFPHVLFARNTSWLSPGAKEILGRLAATLSENPSRRVAISGHTDDVGPEDLNRALSVERAHRCGRWLEGHGVDPERMDIQGFGSTRPVGNDRSLEAQVQNRRVELDLR